MAKQMVVTMSLRNVGKNNIAIIADPNQWPAYQEKQIKKFQECGWTLQQQHSHFFILTREGDNMTFSFDMVDVLE